MLFLTYQVYSSLQGHLHFFVHFSFTFMEHFFFDHPLSGHLYRWADRPMDKFPFSIGLLLLLHVLLPLLLFNYLLLFPLLFFFHRLSLMHCGSFHGLNVYFSSKCCFGGFSTMQDAFLLYLWMNGQTHGLVGTCTDRQLPP